MTNKPFVVLVVEDEPADVYLTRMALNACSVSLSIYDVGDGVEALAFVQRQGCYSDMPTPDLILLDLNMPRMGGKAFLDHFRKLYTLRQIPVVILTTSEAEADIVESYDLGASGFVVKPMDIGEFAQSIQSLLDYWSESGAGQIPAP
ncbi:response regulator [Marinobacter oulmenensis]|uniref:CheY-like chemotaxis protein n=1 Tax=Marinobacter oulmenensis TaxID=643747 RepID=A0A840U3Y8_9GAMM|nr:response regulator [Marinobacter oulmenensis]MBB5320414.1 CheY-like chemotaxis protein [Marinobacter oulmenensis]